MCLPFVKRPKVMGQLASQLFHGQVCVIPSLSLTDSQKLKRHEAVLAPSLTSLVTSHLSPVLSCNAHCGNNQGLKNYFLKYNF